MYYEDMLALLSKALLVLMLVLLLPTGLVFASQDAVPGDRTYPIKRSLENVIVTLVSLHPSTRAFFKADMAGRRYKEAVALVKRGDVNSSNSLIELVTQTEVAAEDIGQIKDPKIKQELVDNLSKQIVEYKTGLAKLENQSPPAAPVLQPTSVPVAQPEAQQSVPPQPTVPVQQPPPASQQPFVTPPPVPPQAAPSGSIKDTIDNLDEISERLHNLSKEIGREKVNINDKKEKKDENRNNNGSGGTKKKSGK